MTQQRHGGPTIEERQRAASRNALRDIDRNQRMMDRNDLLPGSPRNAAAGGVNSGKSFQALVERLSPTRLRPYLLLLLIVAVIGAVAGMVISGL